MTDLQEAYAALSGKQSSYDTLYDYIDGPQPLKYSTARLKDAFKNYDIHFEENWCAVVVDATDDRLNLKGWDTQNEAQNKALSAVWEEQHIFLDFDDAIRDCLITKEGFIIAWKEGDQLDVYRNDPRQCHVFYDPARPKVKRFAAKWWRADRWYMTLYYPDHLEYYATGSKETPSSAAAFLPMETPTAQNPFGVIPVFHFRGSGELGLKITTIQDAINKLLSDMMVSAEFGAFKQKWIISNGDNNETIKSSPYSSWFLAAGDGTGQGTQVGQFDATDLKNFTEPMDRFAHVISVISRTPKHLFYNTGANISGEALIAMESPHTKKVTKYQERLGVPAQELGAFLAKLAGIGDIPTANITPVWEPAESVQPLTEAQIIQTETGAGIPLVTALKRRGASQADIDAMQKDKADEQKRNAAMAPLLLEQARKNSDQSNQNPDGTGNEDNTQE